MHIHTYILLIAGVAIISHIVPRFRGCICAHPRWNRAHHSLDEKFLYDARTLRAMRNCKTNDRIHLGPQAIDTPHLRSAVARCLCACAMHRPFGWECKVGPRSVSHRLRC